MYLGEKLRVSSCFRNLLSQRMAGFFCMTRLLSIEQLLRLSKMR